MARQPRLYAAGYAQLVSIYFSESVQRAFEVPHDPPFGALLSWLSQDAATHRVVIHGWSISPRAIHLLATPADDTSLPQLVQALGRKFAAQLQSGTVFSGRYHSTIPQPNGWVLPSLLWIEQQAYRERLVEHAENWLWSSARAHAGLPCASQAWLQPHPDYWLCGNTPFDRQARYRQKLMVGLSASADKQISSALKGQWALGDHDFIATLQKTASRRVSQGSRGRPRKTDPSPFKN